MLELIGAMTIWLAGLAASFYVPFVGCLILSDRSHNLGIAIIGWWVSWGLVATYVAASFIYFSIT